MVSATTAAYLRRNKKLLAVLGFFILGLIIALAATLRPCDPVYTPADVVVLLDGSGSLSDAQFDLEVTGGLRFVQILRSSTDAALQVSVVQWGSRQPQLVTSLTADLDAAETTLGPGRIPHGAAGDGTKFATALVACGQELRDRGQGGALPICVMVSDGNNNDGAFETYPIQNRGNNEPANPQVRRYCDDASVPARSCSAVGIADHLKSAEVGAKIIGIFVQGDPDQNVAQGKAELFRISSCEGSGSVAEQARCPNFAVANGFSELETKTAILAESLGESLGGTCVEDPAWYLLLVVPLLVYLAWRPLTLFMAKKAIESAIAPPTPPRSTPVPTVELHEEEPVREATPRKREHWSIKASDHYLWNLGGAGAAPMVVDWAGAAPPSAPRARATEANRVKRGGTGLAGEDAVASAARSYGEEASPQQRVYAEHELQPGDLDYEYMRLLLACCGACLRPDVSGLDEGELALPPVRGGAGAQQQTAPRKGRPLPPTPPRAERAARPPPLPPGWAEYVDAESGDMYYSNGEETTWERPGAVELAVS